MAPANVSQAAHIERRRRVRADLVLLSVSLIWGSAFVVQRIAALEVGVFLFNGFRFLLAALVLLPVARIDALRQPGLPGLKRGNLGGVVLVGLALFCGTAFQQAGLQFTTAGNAGFITGLYVVLIPLFMALAWRCAGRRAESEEQTARSEANTAAVQKTVWAAALLAALGLFLLSTGGEMRLNPGDALVLVSAVFWALHVILIGRLVGQVDVLPLAIGQYAVCGAANLLVGLGLEADGFAALAREWWVVAYTAVISVGLGYTLQAVGQRVAPPHDAAIILSGEAVFAALFGWLFLGEALAPLQLLGCAVMLAGMLLAQFHPVE